MPRVSVPVNALTTSGIAPAAEVNGDPVNNHAVANDGRTFVLVRNSNGAATARTLTIVVQGAVEGQGITPKTVSVPAAASRYLGPFNTTNFGSELQLNVDNAELKLSAYRI